MAMREDIDTRIYNAFYNYKQMYKGHIPKKLILGRIEMNELMSHNLPECSLGLNVEEADCESRLMVV